MNKYMNVNEVADFLRVSPPTIRKYLIEGDIPRKKIGKRIIFDRDEVIDWVNRVSESQEVLI